MLHCPHLIGGNSAVLAGAERELGLRSWAVTLEAHPFGYEVNEILFPPRSHLLSPSNKLEEFLRSLKFLHLLSRALVGFDIVHFNFGQTILSRDFLFDFGRIILRGPLRFLLFLLNRIFPLRGESSDLPLLKKAGKGIVVIFQGDDARQGDYCLSHFDISPAAEVEPDTTHQIQTH